MKALSLSFNSHSIHVSRDAWFNATDMANAFGKRPMDWLKQKETKEYIALLCEMEKVTENHLLRTTKGRNGATWLSHRLAIRFAQWLDMRFAIWCDRRIKEMLSGEWQQKRDLGKGYYRMMSDVIQMKRLEQGKDVKPHHFMTDAKLVGWAITGVFQGIDRDKADKRTLSAVNTLMSYNAALVMKGLPYDERKPLLWEKAAAYRQTALLEA